MHEDIINEKPNLKNFQIALAKKTADARKARDLQSWTDNPKRTDEERAAGLYLLSLREEAGEAAGRAQQQQVIRSVPNKANQQGGHRISAANCCPPSELGESFHNPYTFLPFPKEPPARRLPTPITADEDERDRQSGIIRLTVRTLSPLMSCSPTPVNPKESHKSYRALTMGSGTTKKLIHPATGVRGSLRSMLTVITGSPLSYFDDELFLVQRGDPDANLGPASKQNPHLPVEVILAEVITPGGAGRDGEIRLGDTKLVSAVQLEQLVKRHVLDSLRPTSKRPDNPHIWVDGIACRSFRRSPDPGHPWKVKLSGRPVNPRGKREGIFLPSGTTISVPARFWNEYTGRHRHAACPELKEGDLVWIQPADASCTIIRSAADIASLQWARWGRLGESLRSLIQRKHGRMLPDAMCDDGKVSEVTDLFGQVPHASAPGAAGPFAARVRPENLVFSLREVQLRTVTLAPLAPPNPSCIAFYRDNNDLDQISKADGLLGYKVYRTTSETGAKAPWLYETQGVYDGGRLKPPRQKVNKTCELLPAGAIGSLTIAFRSMNKRELSLLLTACTLDWRLGGGKPLGLGHCHATRLELIDESGATALAINRSETDDTMELPSDYQNAIDDLAQRIHMWQAAHRPVERLRYPRAADRNRNTVSRGGHVWFQRHAAARKQGGGLQTTQIDGPAKEKLGSGCITPQGLPRFNSDDPMADQLYGYDFYGESDGHNEKRTTIILESFDETRHTKESDRSGGNHSQNQDSRQKGRDQRKKKGR